MQYRILIFILIFYSTGIQYNHYSAFAQGHSGVIKVGYWTARLKRRSTVLMWGVLNTITEDHLHVSLWFY